MRFKLTEYEHYNKIDILFIRVDCADSVAVISAYNGIGDPSSNINHFPSRIHEFNFSPPVRYQTGV